jgi:predicted transcriptional regulator of viral defense system
MRFSDLLRLAADAPLIDTETLRALGAEPRSLGVQLSRWVRAGRLLQLRRGAYLLPEHLRRRTPPVEQLANLLVRPSYVSLERALSIHGLIPEGVPLVQSVTAGRPVQFVTPVGEFSYRHVKQAWFFGYRELSVGAGRALVATPEKALLDLVHLSRGEFTRERIAALRLQDLDRLDLNELHALAQRSGGPRLRRAAERLAEFVARERQETVSL